MKVGNIKITSGGIIKHWWKLNYFQGGSVPDPVVTPVKYGLLYNWYAATDGRGFTSSDEWIVPIYNELYDRNDFKTLLLFYDPTWVGGDNTVADNLKEMGLTYWNTNDYALNSHGFSARGGGYRYKDGSFSNLNANAGWWINSIVWEFEYNGTVYYGDVYYMQANMNSIFRTFRPQSFYSANTNSTPPTDGNSIRLVRPATPAEQALDDGTPCSNYIQNDGTPIPTVKIGTQVWTAANSCETKFRNGDYIPGFDGGVYTPISNATWAAATTAMCCAYEDNLENI